MRVEKGDLRIWGGVVVWGLSMLEANTTLARDRTNVESSDSGDGEKVLGVGMGDLSIWGEAVVWGHSVCWKLTRP